MQARKDRTQDQQPDHDDDDDNDDDNDDYSLKPLMKFFKQAFFNTWVALVNTI